ncbi:MAG TPA: GAF domain-containing protein [Thermoguttaceae bacterium]|nr:GAF domain-containing protein [Thermoguttaceae bacterium]
MAASVETQPEQFNAFARQQAALLAFGRRSNARPELSVLIQDAVALVSEVLGADFSGVGQVVAGKLVRKVVPRSEQGSAADPVVHESSLAAEDSITGFALREADSTVAANVGSDKRFTDLFLHKLGVGGVLCVPLHVGNKPFGALEIYCEKEREFSQDDVQFAEMIAQLLTSSVGRIQAEEALQQQRAFSFTILETVDALVFTLDARCHLIRMNRACRQVTGFSLAEVQGKEFCSVLAVPEELTLFEGVFRAAVRQRSPNEFEGHLLTKDGSRRNISWSLKTISGSFGEIESIALTGIDRTAEHHAREELEQVKAVAEEANRALTELRRSLAEGDHAPGRSASAADGAQHGEFSTEEEIPTDQPFKTVGEKTGQEQRNSPRRTFQYRQAIAPMYGDVLPSRKKFFTVVCDDISAGGLSFYMENPPEFEKLVVALGQPPSVSFFTAEVVRVIERELDGQPVHLIGCRFTGRAHL